MFRMAFVNGEIKCYVCGYKGTFNEIYVADENGASKSLILKDNIESYEIGSAKEVYCHLVSCPKCRTVKVMRHNPYVEIIKKAISTEGE